MRERFVRAARGRQDTFESRSNVCLLLLRESFKAPSGPLLGWPRPSSPARSLKGRLQKGEGASKQAKAGWPVGHGKGHQLAPEHLLSFGLLSSTRPVRARRKEWPGGRSFSATSVFAPRASSGWFRPMRRAFRGRAAGSPCPGPERERCARAPAAALFARLGALRLAFFSAHLPIAASPLLLWTAGASSLTIRAQRLSCRSRCSSSGGSSPFPRPSPSLPCWRTGCFPERSWEARLLHLVRQAASLRTGSSQERGLFRISRPDRIRAISAAPGGAQVSGGGGSRRKGQSSPRGSAPARPSDLSRRPAVCVCGGGTSVAAGALTRGERIGGEDPGPQLSDLAQCMPNTSC